MHRARAVLFQHGHVQRRAVPLVPRKAVLRVKLVHPAHQPVPADLREDGGGRDALAERVPAHNRAGGQAERRHAVAVHQGQVRPHGKRLHSAPHGEESRLKDIDCVDLPLRRKADAVCRGLCLDDGEQRLALLGAELLGVVDPRDFAARRQNHRGREHRAGERAAARLVDSADGAEPLPRRRALIGGKVPHGSSARSSVIRPIFAPRNSSSSMRDARSVSAPPPETSMPRFFATRSSRPAPAVPARSASSSR